jgi:hypothetical protein
MVYSPIPPRFFHDSSSSCRFHLDRTADRDRHHRHHVGRLVPGDQRGSQEGPAVVRDDRVFAVGQRGQSLQAGLRFLSQHRTPAYDSSKDSVHLLEDPATNVKFVKAMSGRLPTGERPTPTDRKLLNKTAEEFCSFGKDDFESPENLTPASRLVDRFGNLNIRVIYDTDNNTNIRKSSLGARTPCRKTSAPSRKPAAFRRASSSSPRTCWATFPTPKAVLDPGDFAQVLAIQ